MTSQHSAASTLTKPLSLRRRLRRALVRLRISPFSVPAALLLAYSVMMIGLTQVADNWIVAWPIRR